MEYTEMQARDGGRTWRLRYNNRALRWFEKKTGIVFMQIDETKLGMEEITWLAAAGLQHENPDVTIEEADEIIDAVGFRAAYGKVMEALEHDLGGELEQDKPAAVNGTDPKNVSGAGTERKKTQPKSG